MQFTLNNQPYTIEEFDKGFSWTRWDARGHCVDEASDFFDTAYEAQQDAIRDTSKLDEEEYNAAHAWCGSGLAYEGWGNL